MKNRILIASMDVPTQGGAATGAYALFSKMKRDGMDACFLNIVAREIVPYYEWTYGGEFGNLDGVPDVHTCVVDAPMYGPQPALIATIERLAPRVAIARGYIPTLLVGTAVPELPLVCSTAGSQQAEFLIEFGRVAQAVDLPKLVPTTSRLPTRVPGKESLAFDAADAIVAGSELVRDTIKAFSAMEHRYKVHGTPVWSAEWVVESVDTSGVKPKPFEQRTIDVLFSASDWRRSEKNLPMVRDVVSRLAHDSDVSIAIAGDYEHAVAGVEHLGAIVDRRRMFEVMADSKVVAAVSLVDACPTTLFEAARLGCNIVATKNCGNWMLCHDALLVDPPSVEGVEAAVRRGIERPHAARLEWFLEQQSYRHLTEILDALAA